MDLGVHYMATTICGQDLVQASRFFDSQRSNGYALSQENRYLTTRSSPRFTAEVI